ncbi:hypothetical protein COBT_003695 [Conglomerata obtusa]
MNTENNCDENIIYNKNKSTEKLVNGECNIRKGRNEVYFYVYDIQSHQKKSENQKKGIRFYFWILLYFLLRLAFYNLTFIAFAYIGNYIIPLIIGLYRYVLLGHL